MCVCVALCLAPCFFRITMELRASEGSSAAAKACLVAGRYANVPLTEVVDETAAEVVLQLGVAPADGDVKGADAVLRSVST